MDTVAKLSAYSKEDARKMSVAEMNNLAKTNPELFNKLFN
jgi:hypothetical protein